MKGETRKGAFFFFLIGFLFLVLVADRKRGREGENLFSRVFAARVFFVLLHGLLYIRGR